MSDPQEAYVILNGEPLLLDSVKVTDIEEGPSGDVVTFEHKGDLHQSLVVLRP